MPADLLARIAKALENDNPHHNTAMSKAARTLLPEAHAALKIAVEALEAIAKPGSMGVTIIARDALSRLASATKGDDR